MEKALTQRGKTDSWSPGKKRERAGKKPEQQKKTEKVKGEWTLHDYSLIFIILVLLAFGLVLLYSTSSYIGIVRYGDSAYFLKRQLAFTIGGLALMAGISYVPYRWWRYLAVPAFLISVGLIVLLTRYGREVNGATRWLDFKFISMQPSEAAKVAIIICTAYVIELIGRRRLLKIWGFLLPMIPAAISVKSWYMQLSQQR